LFLQQKGVFLPLDAQTHQPHERTVLRETVQTNKGDWQDPYNEEQLKTKFLDLTARLWPKDKSALIYEEIREMGTKDDILFTLKL
jgi:hypothetical protein